ncbi:MAG TPA: hypothetical protein VF902_08090 [Coriobacteriia bacterium]
MRIAVVQHRIRTHERMDLAALLSLAEQAADEDADVVVFPCIPGLLPGAGLLEAFAANVLDRAPQVSLLSPCVAVRRRGTVQSIATRLGRTAVLAGDECIDAGLFADLEALELEALVWQMDTESALQAEATLELALDASLSLAGLVLVSSLAGEARGLHSFGGSAIVHLGELLAEAGDDEDLLLADLSTPVALPVRRGPRPVPAPVLTQRLAVHRNLRPGAAHPSDAG